MAPLPPAALTFEQARLRIRDALAGREPTPLHIPSFRPAAVLVPLLQRPGGPTVLFTRRTNKMQHHAGEVSFPGGRTEAGEDAIQTAQREASEEVGLDPGRVEVLGLLDACPSVWGYVVTPVVAAISAPPERFERQQTEVFELFEVPLATLLDRSLLRVSWRNLGDLPPGSPLAQLREMGGGREAGGYKLYFFDSPIVERTVWGLTAHVLKDLFDRAFGFSDGASEADEAPPARNG